MALHIHASLSHVSITENLQYQKAYQIFALRHTSKVPQTNLKFEFCHGIYVEDARTNIAKFTLDQNGFQFLQTKLGGEMDADKIAVFNNSESVSRYLRGLELQLGQDLKAEKVIIYDWRASLPYFPDRKVLLIQFYIRKHEQKVPIELTTQGPDRSLPLPLARHVYVGKSHRVRRLD